MSNHPHYDAMNYMRLNFLSIKKKKIIRRFASSCGDGKPSRVSA